MKKKEARFIVCRNSCNGQIARDKFKFDQLIHNIIDHVSSDPKWNLIKSVKSNCIHISTPP